MERREMLKATGIAGTAGIVGIGISLSFRETPRDDSRNARIGNGDTTETVESTETETPPIESVDQLTESLSRATAGDVITVDPEAEINLGGHWELTVPAGVTLKGGRTETRPGALLQSPEGDQTPEYNPTQRKIVLEAGARFTGFRLESHFQEYVNPEEKYNGDYYAHRGGGGLSANNGSEVDNNEIYGWPYCAVSARGNAHVHDNFIHHNTWEGLGYGVVIPAGKQMPLIESNYFNYNRHSITGEGGSKTGYIARYNVVGEDWVGSQFDMHGTEGMDGIAGGEIVIEQNTFKATKAIEAKTRDPGIELPAIDIRGTPTTGAWIRQNWFYHDDRTSAVRQPDPFKKVNFSNNHFGTSEPADSDIGAPNRN